MSIKVRAVFDGKTLQLREPLDLQPDSEVKLTVVLVENGSEPSGEYCFIDTALSLNIEGPTD